MTSPHCPRAPARHRLQWPGVQCLSAEEEATAEEAFLAATRSSTGLEELQLCGMEFAIRCGRLQGSQRVAAGAVPRRAWHGSCAAAMTAMCLQKCGPLSLECPHGQSRAQRQEHRPAARLRCSGCIGAGSYARVYQGVDGDCADVALKHEAPPCPWEW